MKVGVVTGMLAEARLLEGLGYRVVAGGGHPRATRDKTELLVQEGVTALLSFGIAGALDPSLKPGDLIIADAVQLADGRTIACDEAWQQQVRDRIGGLEGLIAGRSVAAATRAEKGVLFKSSGALAVDMESHHVAEVASRHGLPFLVIRAVADTAEDTLPQAALVGLNEEGRPAIGAVLLSLLKKPWQLPALIRVALRSRTAMAALLRGRAALL
ncbi:nucleoside phosphorylase [Dongia sp.]|uniref:phosphorylase family protein n=1 Tax=Dongia sp. TaxID=1977262 RepID=UPI0035B1D87E